MNEVLFNFNLFSHRIKLKLEVNNLSLCDAAYQIGISASTLSRLQNGNLPDIYTYYACCKWLGLEMGFFFTETDKPRYNLPYRVGKKQKRVVLDKDGIEVVSFPIGREIDAQEYCDYMNNKTG